MRNRDLRDTARTLAHFMVPKGQLHSQAFWDEHLPLIEYIGAIGAILAEHRYYFPRTRQRKIAWELIVTTDLAWQTIRALSGRSGSDLNWLAKALPKGHDVVFPEGTPLSYAPVVKLVDDITWVFGLHSNLRHPGSGGDYLKLMLADPWPEAQANRLSIAAEGTETILKIYESHLAPGNGFLPDIMAKQKLAEQARKNRIGL